MNLKKTCLFKKRFPAREFQVNRQPVNRIIINKLKVDLHIKKLTKVDWVDRVD